MPKAGKEAAWLAFDLSGQACQEPGTGRLRERGRAKSHLTRHSAQEHQIERKEGEGGMGRGCAQHSPAWAVVVEARSAQGMRHDPAAAGL